MRVAMIGSRGLPATHGGVERAVEAMSRELAEQGHEVTVYGRKGYCVLDRQVGKVRHIPLRSIPTKHLEAASHTVYATLHAIRHRRHYDVVHYHATGPAAMSLLARLAGMHTVATIHGLDWRRAKWGRVARFVLRMAARMAVVIPDETIVVSQQLQREIRAQYGAETTYITNGVNFDELNGPSVPVEGVDAGDYVLFLGRLVPEKQVLTLIEAFRAVDTTTQLVIAGPSQHADDYAAQVEAAAAADPRVLLVGPRYEGEKVWLLKNARVFVQPSSMEGLPIALLEALACGTQALVSDIPENLEAITIREERFGGVFKTGDRTSLAAALQQLLDADERLLPDARGVTPVAFSWPQRAAETEAVYRRATGDHTAASHHPSPLREQPITLAADLPEPVRFS